MNPEPLGEHPTPRRLAHVRPYKNVKGLSSNEWVTCPEFTTNEVVLSVSMTYETLVLGGADLGRSRDQCKTICSLLTYLVRAISKQLAKLEMGKELTLC